MNPEDTARFAAGETDHLPPAPRLDDESEADVVRKDMTYSPSSEDETAQKQTDDELPPTVDDDIDSDAVKVAPGTGGPDDVGDVEVDPDDIDMSGGR